MSWLHSWVRTGITGLIFQKWRLDRKEAAAGKIDFAQTIGIETLIEIIYGSWIKRLIKSIIKVLGYMSAVHMLRLILIYIMRCNGKNCSKSALTCIRCQKHGEICEEYDDSSSENESYTEDQNVHLNLNLNNQIASFSSYTPPPPYFYENI